MRHGPARFLVPTFVAVCLLWLPCDPGLAAPVRQERNCTVSGDKIASPARVILGETVEVRLRLTADCPAAVLQPADVVLAIDQSVSMAQEGKLDAAKAAARAFVVASDLSLHRVAVVAFAATATTTIGLSQDRSAIEAAIDGIGIAPSTNIADAIDTGAQILRLNGRAEAKHVIILISDGSPNQPTPDPRTAALRSANFAKLESVTLFAIGLGADADVTLLQGLASGADHYRFAPAPEDLDAIYESIAVVIAGSAVTELVVVDDVYPSVSLKPGSTSPAAAVAGRRLTWTAGSLPATGLLWTYEVSADRAGTYPTNDAAVAAFRHADGSAGQFVFPRPMITVVDPNEGVPCADPNAWSILVHAFPDSSGRSSAAGRGCNNRFDSADWFAGTHPGLPSLEFQLTDLAGSRTLARGTSVAGPGRVDQRLLMKACDPPPYRLRLVTSDLNGYGLCANSPAEQVITARRFERSFFRSAEVRFGFTSP